MINDIAVSSEEDVENLQSDLDMIYDWQKENNMLFNSKKFEMLRYGSKEELKISTNYLTPDCEILESSWMTEEPSQITSSMSAPRYPKRAAGSWEHSNQEISFSWSLCGRLSSRVTLTTARSCTFPLGQLSFSRLKICRNASQRRSLLLDTSTTGTDLKPWKCTRSREDWSN